MLGKMTNLGPYRTAGKTLEEALAMPERKEILKKIIYSTFFDVSRLSGMLDSRILNDVESGIYTRYKMQHPHLFRKEYLKDRFIAILENADFDGNLKDTDRLLVYGPYNGNYDELRNNLKIVNEIYNDSNKKVIELVKRKDIILSYNLLSSVGLGASLLLLMQNPFAGTALAASTLGISGLAYFLSKKFCVSKEMLESAEKLSPSVKEYFFGRHAYEKIIREEKIWPIPITKAE